MKNSEQPINPASLVGADGNVGSYPGLTKREYFAGLAMQGILSMTNDPGGSALAKRSIEYADELLKQLEL